MCAYKSKVLARADGGTGLSVAGSNGNLLTSNGTNWTSAAPAGGSGLGYTLQMQTDSTVTISDATTYFMRFNVPFATSTTSGAAEGTLYIPKIGTITQCYGQFKVGGTLGSAENTTVAIRLNNTTDTNVTTTAQLTAALVAFGNAALSIAVVAGDYVELKVITPTWVTNPATVSFSATIYIS